MRNKGNGQCASIHTWQNLVNGVESTYRPIRILSLSSTTGGCILLGGRRLTMLRRHFPRSVTVLHTVQTISRGAVLTIDAWLAAAAAYLPSATLLTLKAGSQLESSDEMHGRGFRTCFGDVGSSAAGLSHFRVWDMCPIQVPSVFPPRYA